MKQRQMNDIEMTFLCAEALRGVDYGILVSIDANGNVWLRDDGSLEREFNPLRDDEQAMLGP